MSFATLTDAAAPSTPARDSGFRTWHFYILLSMVGATVAVMLSRETHPAALLLISAAVVSAGVVGVALHHALAGFLGRAGDEPAVLSAGRVAALEREKTLTLRSIKELEFDHQMGKVSDADFGVLHSRLRQRAIAIIEDLERAPKRTSGAPGLQTRGAAGSKDPALRTTDPALRTTDPALRTTEGGPGLQTGADRPTCTACGTSNEPDAKFCKQCGDRLGSVNA